MTKDRYDIILADVAKKTLMVAEEGVDMEFAREWIKEWEEEDRPFAVILWPKRLGAINASPSFCEFELRKICGRSHS